LFFASLIAASRAALRFT